jgi:aminoglycoside phosphotransferase (APT) family kinase protein
VAVSSALALVSGSRPVPYGDRHPAGRHCQGSLLTILAQVDDKLAQYLDVVGVRGGDARLVHGQFHDVVLAGDVAYRFPRDEHSRRALPAAVALLTALANCQLPIAIPVPVCIDHVGYPLGISHVALSRVPGQQISVISDARAQRAVIGQLAGLLDRLAELGADPAIRRLVPRTGPDHWPAFGEQVRQVLFPLMSADGRRRADAELAAVARVTGTGDALVHNDLGGANLLWTDARGQPQLAGVLDWDGASLGNQASDLASIAVTVGWPLVRRVQARRDAVAGQLQAEAEIIASTFALQQALPAALNDDRASLEDGLREYS